MREAEIEEGSNVVGEVIWWSGGYCSDQTPSVNIYKHTSRKSLVVVEGGFGCRSSLNEEFEIAVAGVEVVAIEWKPDLMVRGLSRLNSGILVFLSKCGCVNKTDSLN
jgi:hypothetical protein